ncbi:SMI1/KNR4 family protein [Chitinophaga sp. MM2321]|uniref:SMI1/KNR4 family protein n=1 Tax=Chitinophaga sp. MM2321 TaxID=3137178 RepID=UPI0032D5973D
MTILEELEQEYHFTYPSLYKRLYKDGMLDWGELNHEWINDVYPGLKGSPPLLLFANNFELMDGEGMSEELEDGFPLADKTHRFVPFAFNSTGDWYAFYYNLQNGEDIPIVQVMRDENEAVILAKNLQDFIFSQMLEAVTNMDANTPDLIVDGDFKENCRNFLRTHAPYLTPHQQGIVAAAYEKGGLTGLELHPILEAEISFEWLDKSFKYKVE